MLTQYHKLTFFPFGPYLVDFLFSQYGGLIGIPLLTGNADTYKRLVQIIAFVIVAIVLSGIGIHIDK